MSCNRDWLWDGRPRRPVSKGLGYFSLYPSVRLDSFYVVNYFIFNFKIKSFFISRPFLSFQLSAWNATSSTKPSCPPYVITPNFFDPQQSNMLSTLNIEVPRKI